MRIEMLETVKEEREEYVAEDVRTVHDELGARFCAAGWARDVTGNVPTGPRNPGAVTVVADNASHENKVGDANG